MAEEELYEDVDISEMIEDTDHYFEGNTEETDSENIASILPDTVSEEQIPGPKLQAVSKDKVESVKSTRLPMNRIKNIMKQDPDVSMVTNDAVFLVTKATEMFLETLAKEAYAYTASNKRKVLSKKDLDVVVNKVDCLCFLEGAMDF